jgi:hypothetical protein
LKHLKIFQDEKMALDFALHYSNDEKQYYNESLIEGKTL